MMPNTIGVSIAMERLFDSWSQKEAIRILCCENVRSKSQEDEKSNAVKESKLHECNAASIPVTAPPEDYGGGVKRHPVTRIKI